MEDLNSTLSSILGDPQKMEQLRQVAQSLGINTGAPAQQAGHQFSQQPMQQAQQMGQQLNQQQPMQQDYPQQSQQFNQQQPMQQDFAQQAGQQFNPQQSQPFNQQQTASQFNQQSQQTFQPQSGAAAGGFNPAAFAGIADVLKTFNQRDKNVELLQTLKPHFSSARAGKIDDAVRIMQIIRAWPALRDSGMLGSLGNMFGGGGAK